MSLCVVCAARPCVQLLCTVCEKSYDRARFSDATTWGLLTWAAKRTRRFEKARCEIDFQERLLEGRP